MRTAWIALVVAACAQVGTKTDGVAGVDPKLQRIAALEDARTDGNGLLQAALGDPDARVRERACVALGRLWYPEIGSEVTRPLLGALFDPDPKVRAAAAFALGLRADPTAGDKLVFVALDHHEADADALVRARCIEAASKLDRPDLRERVLDGLLDTDPRVRLEAAQGASRWPTSEPNAAAVDQRLVEHLASEQDRDVILYALFSLERRKAKLGFDQFKEFSESQEPEHRLFAVRGLKMLAPEERVRDSLHYAALDLGMGRIHCDGFKISQERIDPDWRVRCEALLGLGVFQDEESLRCLAGGLEDDCAHVRRNAWEGIGARFALCEEREAFERSFEQLGPVWKPDRLDPAGDEPSLSVRAAALDASTPILYRGTAFDSGPDLAAARLGSSLQKPRDAPTPSLVVAGLARGLAKVPAASAAALLRDMARNGDLLVRETAIESLAKHPSTDTRALLHELLADPDNGIRLAAVTSLAEMPDACDLEPLTACYEGSSGDGASEIRFNVQRAAAKAAGSGSWGLLAKGAADANPFVRRVAREELAKLDPGSAERIEGLSASVPAREPNPLEIPAHDSNPIVDVVTSRGTMRFELFPAETPLHVHNFLELIERKHYDGLTFHRVVPDFVIQGGDYRGDGNGGGTWRGVDDSLRHEIGPRKYVRGSLGMPRNEDPDSGGSQFFVTHRPTPHLDGRYTIFGELRDGFDVLDAIEVGDRIARVVRVR
jgi:cyclophilin family peptidyl-prolyl cis-trans isomerase/HEAT repeat protein